ncbi:molybdopterin-guanine dinucleotide biosynthesis protein B [Paenibacillus brevis]|uniref:Molybdopterin-guanine dinucleotide biosynthesis protein B n=1 Tax=Paenibacillus brevis TaxID=2841508 RepID=A0ABS6FSZ8_9BACL|nr:molybdopterin-guanine dinucleotide biosynthesis protein B [Paenibacillus brevis]MBU5673360.1 molybdopterin-guanine dinucleotide biosynthesis protein B [Paenibacillus brevis]
MHSKLAWSDTGAMNVVPVLQIIGYKNSGKTTLACKLISELTACGLRVGSAKHDAHEFQLDDDGTDSRRHLSHGALETVLTSKSATRVMSQAPMTLDEIAGSMYGRVDILIAEGFKSAHYPKIALLREMDEQQKLLREASNIRLWISWAEIGEQGHKHEQQQGNPVSPSKFTSNSPIPILSLKDETTVIKSALHLALSLL